ncbi:MAG: hypothetical protein IKI66_02980 [Bacteroidales bacterium]|nr:hypothetical protein [Bacteroidales bacterium]
MRYLIRALKYLLYFAIIFILMVGIIYLFSSQKAAGLSFADLFKEGSLPKIMLFFVAVAAIYPYLSFQKKELYLNGPFTNYAEMVDAVMQSLDYVPERKEPDCVTYVKRSAYARLTRMYEDRITFMTTDNPVIVEGYRKDLLRILSLINHRVRQESREQEEA